MNWYLYNPMQNIPGTHIKAYNRTRKHTRKPLCKAPFSNLYFSRSGQVLACCFNRDFPLGTYPEENPHEIWMGKAAKELRKAIGKNDLDKGCGMCKTELLNENYDGVMARHFDFLRMKRKYPVMMEFELDNSCNLECIMCEGDLSSAIRKHRDKKPKIETPYDERFVEYIRPWLKKAELLRFSGGEPFLIPLYYKIWDIAMSENPSCRFYVQTNGTIINEKLEKYISSGRFDLGVSLDSMNKQRFEAIRVGANYDEVIAHIKRFISLKSPAPGEVSLVISCTVVRENWQDIPEVLEFANSLDAQIVFNTVWNPRKHAIHNLEVDQLDEIYRFYANYRPADIKSNEKHNAGMYRGLVQQVKHWLDDAINADRAQTGVAEISPEEMLKALRRRISRLQEDNPQPAKKFEELIARISHTPEYPDKLRLIYHSPDKDILEYLKKYSTEKLIGLLDTT